MKPVSLVAQYLLAAMMVVFGLNKFMNFLPMPEPDGKAADYMDVVVNSYIWSTLGILYLASAVLLLFNRAVGLATVILVPLAFNAFMFHLTMDQGNIALAAAWVVLLVLTILGNLGRYKNLFT